jgi:hypothetical protein
MKINRNIYLIIFVSTSNSIYFTIIIFISFLTFDILISIMKIFLNPFESIFNILNNVFKIPKSLNLVFGLITHHDKSIFIDDGAYKEFI